MTETLIQMIERMIVEIERIVKVIEECERKVGIKYSKSEWLANKDHLTDLKAIKAKLEEAGEEIANRGQPKTLNLYCDKVLGILGLKKLKP